MPPKKKMKSSSYPSISLHFQVSAAKTNTEATSNQPEKNSNRLVKPLGFARNYHLFEECQANGILYDIGLLCENGVSVSDIPDDVKYEMLVERKYLPCNYAFPYNNDQTNHLDLWQNGCKNLSGLGIHQSWTWYFAFLVFCLESTMNQTWSIQDFVTGAIFPEFAKATALSINPKKSSPLVCAGSGFHQCI